MREKLILEYKKIKNEFRQLIINQGRQKVIAYLYVVFSLFAVTIFGLFAIGPTLATISELHKEKEDAESTLEQLEDKNQALQKLSGEYQQITSDVDFVYEAIPKSPKIPELTRKVELIANQNNLAINTLSTGAVELYPAKRSGSPLFSYTINITTIGSESDINAFIQDIINFDRIISIEKVSSGQFERGLFTATVTGRAFFIND